MSTKSRIHYANELQSLNEQILLMGTYVEEALRLSIEALQNQDTDAAEKVREGDRKINSMETELFDKVAILLATEQPVAGDLRYLTGAIRVITDLERAGDYAVHIAEGAIRLSDEKYITPLRQIPAAAERARGMLRDALTAFIHSDEKLAREVAARDDELDDLHHNLLRKMLTYMVDDKSNIEQAANLIFLARFLERLGDHVTNICEWVVYCSTGEHVEL